MSQDGFFGDGDGMGGCERHWRAMGSSETFVQVVDAANRLVEQVARSACCDDRELLAQLDAAIACAQISHLTLSQVSLAIQVKHVSPKRSVVITITMTVQMYPTVRELLVCLLQRICAGETEGSFTDGETHASFSVDPC